MNYQIANPTGNITVLVTTDVPAAERFAVVHEMFDKEPTCEQVGFVKVPGGKETDGKSMGGSIALEMMGGEFCGNATMSAAAYLAKLNGLEPGAKTTIKVDSSGADEPVEVEIVANVDGSYQATLEMPMPTIDGTVVHLDGISHMIVPADKMGHEEAEAAIKSYAEKYDALAFGILLYSEESDSAVKIEPLVYVRGSETMVWEHGCASGSIAAAYYKHAECGANKINVSQPGGVITVEIDQGKLYLTGRVEI